jgi:hypothetical protein
MNSLLFFPTTYLLCKSWKSSLSEECTQWKVSWSVWLLENVLAIVDQDIHVLMNQENWSSCSCTLAWKHKWVIDGHVCKFLKIFSNIQVFSNTVDNQHLHNAVLTPYNCRLSLLVSLLGTWQRHRRDFLHSATFIYMWSQNFFLALIQNASVKLKRTTKQEFFSTFHSKFNNKSIFCNSPVIHKFCLWND